eukprot:TRINITY_DN6564_c0_g1_i1.p1 TRINITY_DN6564_c0_g1~~TRINITY_DN6564_c0_g1_i1.p1  ORF type:complete len:338 (-),score=104.82 TRINITY_DN6564_c0_g1_i1:53-934(-)
MPNLALGTWKSEPAEVKEAVAFAIETGYRHIDCAPRYGNERSVGEGIVEGMKRAGITRKDLFVTSKLWNSEHKQDRILGACQQTLHDLGLNYLDLYLIHWPITFRPHSNEVDEDADIWETWESMQYLKEEGLVNSLGVSNFTEDQLEALLMDTDVLPIVNQVEFHPYFVQNGLMDYCKKNQIQVTGYSPLGTGLNSKQKWPILIQDPIIYSIGKSYNKTPAQVILRWAIQSGVVPLPKSVNPTRIKENFQVYDFELSQEDMKRINNLNANRRHVHPEWATHFNEKSAEEGEDL